MQCLTILPISLVHLASDASSEEEAEDWDELEKKAAREDKEKRRRDMERDEAERTGNKKARKK